MRYPVADGDKVEQKKSAKPVADGDKAEQKKSATPVADKQKKEPAKDVCFHKFRFSSLSQTLIFIFFHR